MFLLQGTQAAGETSIIGSWSEIVSEIFNGWKKVVQNIIIIIIFK